MVLPNLSLVILKLEENVLRNLRPAMFQMLMGKNMLSDIKISVNVHFD